MLVRSGSVQTSASTKRAMRLDCKKKNDNKTGTKGHEDAIRKERVR